jgi:hypothetical protein
MLYLGTSATLLAMVTAGSRAVIAESLQVDWMYCIFGLLPAIRVWEDCTSVFAFSTLALVLYSQIDLFQEGLDFPEFTI